MWRALNRLRAGGKAGIVWVRTGGTAGNMSTDLDGRGMNRLFRNGIRTCEGNLDVTSSTDDIEPGKGRWAVREGTGLGSIESG